MSPDSTDTPAELELVRRKSLEGGADAAVVSNHWAEGGAGARLPLLLLEWRVVVCGRVGERAALEVVGDVEDDGV